MSAFSDYLALVPRYRAENPAQREGQAHFNLLRILHPRVAEEITGDLQRDPFYVDNRLPAFLSFVETRLGKA